MRVKTTDFNAVLNQNLLSLITLNFACNNNANIVNKASN